MTRVMIRHLGAAALMGLVALPAAGQRAASGDGAGSGGGGGVGVRSELVAVERSGAIQVDGRLGEPAWEGAAVVRRFVQGEPVEGAPAEQPTEVRILFDDEAIYVGALMTEPDPSRIARQLVRRDDRGQADYFEVMFDPNQDRRTGYLFRVSAAGVQRDSYLHSDNQEDDSWDAVWESEVELLEDGWSVEMRIPWSQIRYEPSTEPQTWGINFARWRLDAAERTYYALIPRAQHGRVSFFETISGVEAPQSLRRIELRPYTLARGHRGPATAGDPFFDGAEADAQVGVDLRYGLGSAFTLDATINPDFGQVELDPAVINLSAFETFFPERRPFFVEDARILDFTLAGRQNLLFYSRRIGREPQGRRPDEATFTTEPEQTTILGAAKLTGRTTGGLSVGALAAVTGEEEGRAFFPGDGLADDRIEDYLAEPRGQYGVVRAQQDLRDGATTVGGIVTAMGRDLPADGSFDFLPSQAFSAGIDFEHMWGDREWALTGFVAGSLVRGDSAALIRIQRSSNHYFQRPDSDFTVDSSRTSLAGAEWRLEFERRSGEHWTGSIWAGEVTPGFEINDFGYSRSTERLDAGGRVSYREIQPGPVFRDYNISLWTYHNWRHDALDDAFSMDSWGAAHKAGGVNLSTRGTLNNFWGGSVDLSYTPETLDDGGTRGGPLMVDPNRVGIRTRVNSDRRKAISLDGNLNYDVGPGGTALRGGLGVTARPSPRWELGLEPGFNVHDDRDQYVTSVDDASFAPTYGRRYLFGELERRSFSLETRMNVTFTRNLTLQLFAQPLLEAGHYTAYKQLAEAGTYDFLAMEPGTATDGDGDGVPEACDAAMCALDGYRWLDFDGDGAPDNAFRDRDFNVVSLLGNAVLRWEYRPGSTIFLVWQQRRGDRRAFGDFDFARDRADMLDLQPDNVFIIKVNYWLGL